MLTLEVSVSIDVVILHCDIGLYLIDCEKNSAVISFNESSSLGALSNEVLVTFRCQLNTTRLEIRLRPVEGRQGLLTVYIISRITPKCAQSRFYTIHPLSLHRRTYSHTSSLDTEPLTRNHSTNKLSIQGDFTIQDGHSWLRGCIPEVPEKVALSSADVESELLYFVSTLTETVLVCNAGNRRLNFTSDNLSTISILKDYVSRQTTKDSIPIEMNVDINEQSMVAILDKLYGKIRKLVMKKRMEELCDATQDLQFVTNSAGKSGRSCA